MKKLYTILVTLALSTLFSMTAFAQAKVMPDGGTFDVNVYSAQNPDVVAVLGIDENTLYQHYVTAGKAEGRVAFNPIEAAMLPNSQEHAKLMAPTEAFVLAGVGKIAGVKNFLPVTESHDPNHKLNKQGGYTACVYFRHELVTDSYYDEKDVIDAGTSAGGCIEVFRNANDAANREKYLASFDSSLAPGSHFVVGTCVIRTSRHLTASQQAALTNEIVRALVM